MLRSLRKRQAHSREGVLALRRVRVQERLQRLVDSAAVFEYQISPIRNISRG